MSDVRRQPTDAVRALLEAHDMTEYVGTEDFERMDDAVAGVDQESSRHTAALAAKDAEIGRLRAKLKVNECNSGHKTLPITFWDCPVCVQERRSRLESENKRLRAALEWYAEQVRDFSNKSGTSIIDEWGADDALYDDAGARARAALTPEKNQ